MDRKMQCCWNVNSPQIDVVLQSNPGLNPIRVFAKVDKLILEVMGKRE